MVERAFIVVDQTDIVIRSLMINQDAHFLDHSSQIEDFPKDVPVVVRGLGSSKIINLCEKTGRDYYYIDTGYLGNTEKKKLWHRIVKNNVQNLKPRFDLPDDRFEKVVHDQGYLKFDSWKKDGRAILLVTPSNKPCKFYEIDRNDWVDSTMTTIKEHTDRPIIVRDKPIRKNRINESSIFTQFKEDKIFAVVTYNSIAAVESISYGIPSFTMAPNAADCLSSRDLSTIDNPVYAEEEKVRDWQNWLAYCQYGSEDFSKNTVFDLIDEYDLS